MINSMKRISLLTAIVILMSVFGIVPFSAAAAGGFYCRYSPKTENSSVFYIDIYSSGSVSAAVMELYYDSGFAEYREADTVGNTSVVRDNCEGGCVKLAFADSGVVTGELCRVAFKALQAGTCTFTLRVPQASDADAKPLDGYADYALEVKLGKNDVVSGASSKSAQASSKASSKMSSVASGAGKSTISSRSYLRDVTGSDERADPGEGGVIDVRRSHAWTYVLIGVGSVLLVAALIFAGVLIGKKNFGKENRASDDRGSADDPPAEDNGEEAVDNAGSEEE